MGGDKLMNTNYNKDEVINDLCLRIANLTLSIAIKDSIIGELNKNVKLYEQQINSMNANMNNIGGIPNE